MIQHGRIVGEDLDLDRLWRIREVADHVLQHLGQLDVQFRLSRPDPRPHIFHHVIDAAAALGFELYREVAGIGLSHRGQPHLQSGSARRALHFRRGVENTIHMLQNAVCLIERTARGHDVVKDEAAFVHLRQQVGAKRLVSENVATTSRSTCAAEPQRLGQRPIQNLAMNAENAREQAARGMIVPRLPFSHDRAAGQDSSPVSK